MKHKSGWVSFLLIISFTSYFLWLASRSNDETSRLGYYGIAASFLISLIPALEAVFGRGDNPNELLFKVQQLTDPLQKITASLAFGPRLIPEAVSILEKEIEVKALLGILKKDSPELAQSMNELKILAAKYSDLRPDASTSLDRVLSGDIMAQRNKLASDETAKQLTERIKTQIEELFAKYGGSK